jgi:hypothetical protein
LKTKKFTEEENWNAIQGHVATVFQVTVITNQYDVLVEQWKKVYNQIHLPIVESYHRPSLETTLTAATWEVVSQSGGRSYSLSSPG